VAARKPAPPKRPTAMEREVKKLGDVLEKRRAPADLGSRSNRKPGATKIPKSLAQCADLLYTTKEQRLKLQREQLEPLKKTESALKLHLIENLPLSNAKGVTGSVANATIKKESTWRVEDEAAFLKFAKRKGNEDLLKTVPNKEAIEERWEQGKKIPGVVEFEFKKVSLTKAK
jgi:hypothetical protein